ncbi:MAG: hypothetical protein H6684_16735 [Deltaproteobacteria bacterium]|nr:hypothetical protein [Deltaproteobacteria bacterium]MCB9490381.1 hypothetical protein [Deltaproteobacteria bacterium]
MEKADLEFAVAFISVAIAVVSFLYAIVVRMKQVADNKKSWKFVELRRKKLVDIGAIPTSIEGVSNLKLSIKWPFKPAGQDVRRDVIFWQFALVNDGSMPIKEHDITKAPSLTLSDDYGGDDSRFEILTWQLLKGDLASAEVEIELAGAHDLDTGNQGITVENISLINPGESLEFLVVVAVERETEIKFSGECHAAAMARNINIERLKDESSRKKGWRQTILVGGIFSLAGAFLFDAGYAIYSDIVTEKTIASLMESQIANIKVNTIISARLADATIEIGEILSKFKLLPIMGDPANYQELSVKEKRQVIRRHIAALNDTSEYTEKQMEVIVDAVYEIYFGVTYPDFSESSKK